MSLHSTVKVTAQTQVKSARCCRLPRNVWLSGTILLMMLVVWWGVAVLYWVSPLFLPASQQVLHQLIIIASPQGFRNAMIWQHLVASLGRIMAALLAAVIIGIPVGFAMGLNDTVRGILDLLIEIYRPVPPLAYFPLMVIWFGIGETSKILLISLAIFVGYFRASDIVCHGGGP